MLHVSDLYSDYSIMEEEKRESIGNKTTFFIKNKKEREMTEIYLMNFLAHIIALFIILNIESYRINSLY